MPYICTAERNGEARDFCLDESGNMECFGFWNNVQQFHCPYWRQDVAKETKDSPGILELNLPVGATTKTIQEIAHRIFGENIAKIYEMANANLIAAAPDLLEVAETMVTYERSLPPKFVDMAREAIAKAKGE